MNAEKDRLYTQRAAREHFWNVLNELRDSSEESIAKLQQAIPPFSQLCRFRAVNEGSLQQLQDNALLFSSANYYDDPFDTYFQIDYRQVRNVRDALQGIHDREGKGALYDMVRKAVPNQFSAITAEAVRQIDGPAPDPSVIQQAIAGLIEQIQSKSFTICFGDDPLNENLWLKYADGHKGFVQIYDSDDEGILIKGVSAYCDGCTSPSCRVALYPIYYSDEGYDATHYALCETLLQILQSVGCESQAMKLISDQTCWELERISLIKRRCHEYDGEWRLMLATFPHNRPRVYMRPSAVALGLRMPEYERRLVISAAHTAGIEDIEEMYISDDGRLAMRPA